MAKTYPISEAKAKLVAILRDVKRGRRVMISERGETFAMITPVTRDGGVESRVTDLEQAGVIRKASAPLGQVRPLARKPGALRRFLETRE